MDAERTRGQLDLLLLGVLAAGPGHGYAVIQALRDRSDGVFELREGAVYPALHRLEEGGLLSSEWQPVGGRRRRVYHLTQAGAMALEQQRDGWSRFAGAVEAVLKAAIPAGTLAAGASA